MNLYQKLIEVRKSCEYLKKDNQGYQFQYVSSSQTLGTLRGKMDELGLLLVPTVESFEVREHTTQNGGKEHFTILEMSFTWINAEKPEETLACKWTGQGLDSGEKGVGKALTYAEKYFLLKFFNIATDKDDPDSFQKQHKQETVELIKEGQVLDLSALISEVKADEAQFCAYFNVKKLELLPASKYKVAVSMLEKKRG